MDFERPVAEDARVLHAWHGENAGDQFGWVAIGAGDVNGDGCEDVITSAPFAAGEAGAAAGYVYLYSGKDGALLHRFAGGTGERLGISVAALGDLNADGCEDVAAGTCEVSAAGDWNEDGTPDLLLSIPLHDGGRGALEVRSGSDGTVLFRRAGETPGENFASTVCIGGRDGLRMLVAGAMNAGPGRRGRVIVFDAPSGKERFRRDASTEGVNFGRFFSSVPGDVNADGYDDVYAVDFESNAGGTNSGEVVLLSGLDGALLHRFVGQPGDGLGIGDAVAGDVDGDGCADLLTGAWNCSDAVALGGAAYVYSGRTGRVLHSLTCRIPGATFGFDSTTLADVDGDGKRDWLVSAAWTAVVGPQTGSVYLFAGR